MDYNILYETDYDTVVARYEDKRKNNKSYQSEKELENEFIHNLTNLGYEYINIKNEKEESRVFSSIFVEICKFMISVQKKNRKRRLQEVDNQGGMGIVDNVDNLVYK